MKPELENSNRKNNSSSVSEAGRSARQLSLNFAADPVHLQAEDLLASAVLHDGLVMNGDPEPQEEPSAEVSAHMSKGFPARPRTWPQMMAWPPQPQFDQLNQARVSDEERRAFFASLEELRKQMEKRAQQINEYIATYNNPDERQRHLIWRVASLGLVRRYNWEDRRNMRHLRKTHLDPYYGINWASLLDEKSTRPAANLVRRWSHTRAYTNDGGLVIAKPDTLHIRKSTPQAAALAVQEGIARGWGSLNMQGPPAFCEAAIQAARQANVKAEIIELYGIGGFFKRRHVIMPVPPGSDEMPTVDTKEIDTDQTPGNDRPDTERHAVPKDSEGRSVNWREAERDDADMRPGDQY